MKTTVEISDSLFNEAKRLSGQRGMTLREVIEMSLRNFLMSQKTPSKPFKLRWHTFRGKGLVAGLSEGDWPELRRLAYEGRGG